MDASRKYSVIVPVYNAEATLCRCVDSILGQTYKNFELILVDDGSTDNSGVICDEYAAADSRVRVFHKPNGGVSSARNMGISKAKGEYIAFSDADDEVLPQWLDTFVNNIQNTDICIQGIQFIGNTCIENRIIGNYVGGDAKSLVNYLISNDILGYLFSKLFKTEIVKKYDVVFDESIHFREDDLFVLKYIEHITSWVSVSNTNYKYYVPKENKQYKSSATECTEKEIKSLNNIYNGNIPENLCEKLLWSVKGAAIEQLLEGKRLSQELLVAYENVVASKSIGFKSKFIDRIVLNSFKCRTVSSLLIRLIHRTCC